MRPLLASLIIGVGGFWVLQARGAVESSITAGTGQITKLTRPVCKTLAVGAEGGDSEQICPGLAGHKLLLLDSDGRMSVTVVTPNGTKHPLNFATVVTSHFSVIGEHAEWRFREDGVRRSLVSLIIPLQVKEDPDSGKATTFWVVTRIGEKNICVVRSIKHSPGSLEEARRVADTADKQSCLADNLGK